MEHGETEVHGINRGRREAQGGGGAGTAGGGGTGAPCGDVLVMLSGKRVPSHGGCPPGRK